MSQDYGLGAGSVLTRCGLMQPRRGLAWCVTTCLQHGLKQAGGLDWLLLTGMHSGQPMPWHMVDAAWWLAWHKECI